MIKNQITILKDVIILWWDWRMTSVPSLIWNNVIVKTPDSGMVMLGDKELNAHYPVLKQLEIYHQGNLKKNLRIRYHKTKWLFIYL